MWYFASIIDDHLFLNLLRSLSLLHSNLPENKGAPRLLPDIRERIRPPPEEAGRHIFFRTHLLTEARSPVRNLLGSVVPVLRHMLSLCFRLFSGHAESSCFLALHIRDYQSNPPWGIFQQIETSCLLSSGIRFLPWSMRISCPVQKSRWKMNDGVALMRSRFFCVLAISVMSSE